MREQSWKFKKDSLFDYECETAGMNSIMINITGSFLQVKNIER